MGNENSKCFQVLSESEGTFTLWDKFFGQKRIWKVSDDSHPGIQMIQDRINKEANDIRSKLPDNYLDLPKNERQKVMKKVLSDMSDEQRIDYTNRLARNSDKQIALQSSYVEPIDENGNEIEIPDIWDNKIEFYASCLSDDGDIAKVSDFFFKHLSDSTVLPEESSQAEKA